MADAKRTEVMDCSLEALWEVIIDYEGYPKFVDGVKKITVLERKGSKTRVQYELDMLGKKITYVILTDEVPMKSVKWSKIEGDFFKSIEGSWALKPLGDNQVEATYTLSVGFPLLVPKTIVNMLVGSQLPTMLKGFEAQAKKRMKKPAKSGKKGA
ncbi:MAG: SRPBCC family protein [Bdellovibrionales bacterium]|nr:SRPBCC family protein [Bdellovibrionales bacterium]